MNDNIFDDQETYSVICNQTGEIVESFKQGAKIINNPLDDLYIHNYRKGESFVKIWDKAVPILMEKLTKPEFWVAMGVTSLISYNDNILRTSDGKRADVHDISKIVGMEYDATRKIITSLKKKGILFVGDVGCIDNPKVKVKSIVANPRIYIRGAKELREIDGLFSDSGWK